jgi:hypothetical protein
VHDGRIRIFDGDVGEVWIPWEEVRKATTEHEFPTPTGKKKGMQR